jgi:uncharacterized membrane protein
MADDFDDASLADWVEFAGHDHGGGGSTGSWRHPVVYVALAIGVAVLIGLVVLRPTGAARSDIETQRSVLGLPTDFFSAEVSAVTVGPCAFFPEQECATVSFLLTEGPDAGRTYVQTFTQGGSTPEFREGQRVVLSYRAPNGRVDAVSQGACDFDPSQTCDVVAVAVTRGERFGETVTVYAMQGFEEFRVGANVDISFDEDGAVIAAAPADLASQYQFSDFERSWVLLAVFVAFCASVIALGAWRGVAALAGLGATLVIVVLWLLPAILEGRSPALVALVGASAVSFVALYLSHGVSRMTTVALIGTIGALVLTTALSAITVTLANFTGFATEESTLLVIFDGIDVRGLVLAGMVLGAAGALDDVAVTQASSVWQLKRSRPDAGFGPLWSGGLRIGQHHIGSTVNTLLLAYLGASLPLAILFTLADQSLGTVVNSEIVAVEIVRTLVGSIGLVAAVPLTTWLAATIASREGEPPASSQ